MSYDYEKSNLYNAVNEFLEEHTISELLEIIMRCIKEKEQSD